MSFRVFCLFGLFRAAPVAYGGPRLGIELDYATATATQDLSCVCDLHHSSRQCRILNPLGKVRDRTFVLLDTSRVRYCWATTETLSFIVLFLYFTFEFMFSKLFDTMNFMYSYEDFEATMVDCIMFVLFTLLLPFMRIKYLCPLLAQNRWGT